MVFNGNALLTALFFALLVWLGAVTALLVRMLRHYNRLTSGTAKTGLREVLDVLLDHQGEIDKRLRTAEEVVHALTTDGGLHFQRVGIVRFNPFADTGGAQSFTLALLDGEENGIVMTSLYGRSGNRWYVKEVVGGYGHDLELSKEEQDAIRKAKTSRH